MSVIIEEVIAETTAAPAPDAGRFRRRKDEAPKRQAAWIERRDLVRCLDLIEQRRERLDTE